MKAFRRIFRRKSRHSTPPPSISLLLDSSLSTPPHSTSDSSSHPPPPPDSQPSTTPSNLPPPSSSSPGPSTQEITLHNTTQPLAHLPAELLAQIATFLPNPSSALLAITCKTILKKLGTTYFAKLSWGKPGPDFRFYFQENLPYHQREREAFLLLLEKDLPSLIYCHFCRMIHDTLKMNNYNRKCTSDLARHDCRALRTLDNDYSRRYLLMRRHRTGHDISKELEKFSRSDILQLPESTVKRVHTAKIIDGDFRTRTQHSITLPKGGEREALVLAVKCQSWDVCSHLTWSEYNSILTERLYCRLKHPNKPCDKCAGMKQCNRCWVEFEINTVDLGDGRFTLEVTSWRDLGAVDTPLDVKFRFLQRYRRRFGVTPAFEGLKRDFQGEKISSPDV